MIERVAVVIRALSEESAEEELMLLTRQVKASGAPVPKVADALISYMEAEPEGEAGFSWAWVVSGILAGCGAAAGGAWGLQAMLTLFPLPERLAFLPVLGVLPMLLGVPAGVFEAARRRKAEVEHRVLRLGERLLKAGVSGVVALDLASYVVGIETEAGRALFSLDSGVGSAAFAVRRAVLGRAPSRRRLGAGTVLVGFGLAWIIVAFWAVYFGALGAGAQGTVL